ncbi:hypothetical protein RDI58_014143 [Solanum bulbocastanum]|uniref:Uncharacterized protein n=1 Tax=Solanum bulbocastanum TaxID=147425 RepID=A0AAN8TT88_SOLBU
MIGYRLNQ